MSRVAPLAGRHLVRQLRTSAAASATIVTVCLFSATVVGAVPRVALKVSQDDLRQVVADAEPEQRNIRIEAGTRIDSFTPSDPYRYVERRGGDYLDDDIPDSIQPLIADHQFVVDAPRLRVASYPDDIDGPFPTSVTFRHQQDLADHLRLVEGRLPERHAPVPMLRGHDCPPDPLDIDALDDESGLRCEVVNTPVFEAAISPTTAEVMGLSIDDYVMLRPDGSHSNWFGAPSFFLNTRLIMVVSGIVEPLDPGDEFWFADTALDRPRITENADYRLIFATAITAEDHYGQLLHQVPYADFDYTWRYLVDTSQLDVATVEQVRADIDKIAPAQAQVVSQLPTIIDGFLERRRLSAELASTAVFGLAALAAAVVLMVALLLAQRIAVATVLARHRGASRSQVVAAAVVRSIALVVPASIAGWSGSALLVSDTPPGSSFRAVAAFATGATAFVFAAMFPAGRDSPAATNPAVAKVDSRLRRLVLEALVVVVAAGAVLALRRRGSLGGNGVGFDPVLAVAPALVALSVGIAALRAAGWLGRLLARAGARHRGLSPLIGFRRLAVHPFAERLPVLVMIVGVGIATFSMIVHASIDDGRQAHSRQIVGADMQVFGQTRSSVLPVAAESIANDVRLAEAAEFPAAEPTGTGSAARIHVLAVDSRAYRLIAPLNDHDRALLDSLGNSPPGTIAAIVSSNLSSGGPPAMGATFEVDLGRGIAPVDPTLSVVGVVDRFPSIPENTPFIVVDLAALRDVDPSIPVRPSLLFGAGTSAAIDAVGAALAESSPSARVVSRYEVLDDLQGSPLARWSSQGLLIAALIAVAFTVGSGIAWVALTGPGRSRDLALLNTVGLRRRQATAIVVAELVPLLLVALLAGTTVGITLARLLAPALDLEAFTGQPFEATMVVDPIPITLAATAIVGVTLVAMVAFASRSGDVVSRTVLRVGGER